MTPEQKAEIDAMDHYQLLQRWRFSAAGDPIFVGEAGQYFQTRMQVLRDADRAGAVANSKAIG